MQLYKVVYRTGGTLNFKWRESIAFSNLDVALKARDATRIMGYPAFVMDNDYGLPTAYIPETFKNWFRDNPDA